ncbi:hypothetical protein KFL_001870210 [Klebsormidium nitens]|uniref:Uncharacterized protein n=1 Tax=Klebsormidium nitens TaxID=105231 RepID=A0A1Y1I4P8_KLENI|nr:hypothetical protein KFL_001870210 [Klebsormidium nitens]|eukprot:GAQ84399.1 hypothetical protein KFL_001870210 [Klebsormidium nitens]
MATEAACRSSHLLGLSKSVNHHKSDWHDVAAPIRHAITLLCETLHEQMAGMQRVESELARLRLQVGSTEHSQAALEATVQGQLDACVHHVEKRLFKAAQAKVPLDELEGCIQAVRDRVEHIVSEGLAATVGPLQEQLTADSQHTAQLCVRLDALDAQQKKVVLRLAKHQKHIGASELAVENLQARMAGAEEAALRTSDAVSSAQACVVEVGRQWDAASREHAALRQRLDQLATSTEEQVRQATTSTTARLEAVEARTAGIDQGEHRLEDKLGAFAAGQERLERELRAGQERLEKQVRAGQERFEKEARAGQERLEKGVKGLEDLRVRVAGLERAQEDAAAERGAAGDELRGHLQTLESKTAKDIDKQAARLNVLEASVSATPRLIQDANEAAVAGLVAQVSSLGRAAEEAASRAGRADDKAREAMGAASQNQTAITGMAATFTQLTRQVEGVEQKAEEAKGRLDMLEEKQHKLTLSVHTAVAEQMAHVPTTTHVERLLADQGEQLAAGWRAAQDAAQADGTRRDAELRQLQAQCDALQKVADQLKAGLAMAVTPAALDAALAGVSGPLNKELQQERAASAVVAQRVSDVEARLQQQLLQLRQDGDQLKTGVAGAVTAATLEAALGKATAALNKELETERAGSADLTRRLGTLEGKLEAARKESLETLDTRVSAAQSASEKQAAELVDAQVGALRQQLTDLTAKISTEVAGVREGLQEQIDHRCQELAGNCRARAAEQATKLEEQAKQMEPVLLKLTGQMESIQRLCRQELQSVRVALESKASTDQMMELKTVLSEVDKLRSQVNSGTSTPRRSVVGSSLRPTTWKA